MDNHTKQTDPSVEYLVQMFPEEFLRNLAQKTGFIKRSIVSVVADGVKSVKLFPERTSEAKSWKRCLQFGWK